MPKRILVVENSDAVRGVAETVLRQNGFEVIGVADSGRASEVLDHTRPDVLLVGVEVEGTGQKPYFEQVKQDHRTGSIPMLVFADKAEGANGLPPEVIIPCPFEPRDLLEKVSAVVGQASATSKKENPLADGSLEDDFLDAALGLNSTDSGLEVTDSEVMDKTQMSRRQTPKSKDETVVGFDDDHVSQQDSGRVESIRIEEEQTDIRRPAAQQQRPQPQSDGLDILEDQYGISNPDAVTPQHESDVHDYNWFINSMQNEAANKGKPKASSHDDGELQFTNNSSYVDPKTPGPTSQQLTQAKGKDGSVDKYIDEFKRELENLRHDDPEIEVKTAPPPSAGKTAKSAKLTWEESIDRLNEEQLRIFTREFADRLAEKIAARITDKIDTGRLLEMLKNEVIEQVKRKSRQ